MSCPPSKLALLLVLFPALAAAASSEEELFFKSVADVNEGQLKFLPEPPAKAVHHHQNRIVVTDDSVATGWVRLEQCHRHLDPVPSTQVVYNRDRIRGIAILRSENIGRAWVHENTVQLEQVQPAALICIQAETRALRDDGAGAFSLANGPYMRRFLDGYYPMGVSLQVSLSTPRLRFDSIEPAAQPGFQVRHSDQEVAYDAWFEGRLNTLIRFRRVPAE